MDVFVESKSGPEVESDLFVVGFFEDDDAPQGCFADIDRHLDGALSLLIKEGEIKPEKEHVQIVHTLGKLPSKKILCVGLGKKEAFDVEQAKKTFALTTKVASKHEQRKLSYCLPSFIAFKEDALLTAHALAETSVLSAYEYDDYKTKKEEQIRLEKVSLCMPEEQEELAQAVQNGQSYGEGTCLARDLINTPGNHMTPTRLAEKAVELAQKYDFEYDILDREDMEEKGMGALLAVAQGGAEPPKMIVLKYQGREKWEDEHVLGLVGKGLTFDTGGISLKPAQDMRLMKFDMGGSAAVLGAMDVIGRLKPETNVIAVIPSTENMPSGTALKPGDVITSMAGKTIEVNNTDAEGRLILADGITYAKQLGATHLVDVATLTGAALIALGDCTTGVVSNDESFVTEALEAGHESGELMWRLPDYEPYKKMVKSSEVADLNNAPGRLAGTITAGLFLGEFADNTPWVHLDIAGTVWKDKEDDPATPKGGTGVMVRTLSTLADRFSEK